MVSKKMSLMILSSNEKLKENKSNETYDDMVLKFLEESNELLVALLKKDMANVNEEVFDCMQVLIGILIKLEDSGVDIYQLCNRHNKKLLARGWKDKGMVNLLWCRDSQ